MITHNRAMQMFIRVTCFVCLFVCASIAATSQTGITNNVPYKIRKTARGIEVEPFRFDGSSVKKNDTWTADWIWLNRERYPDLRAAKSAWSSHEEAPASQYRALFRKEFTLASLPEGTTMFISADVAYRLYINDSLVSQGPVNVSSDYGDDSAPKYWFYAALDIQSHLRKGRNLVAIEVFSWAFEISQATRQQGRLIAEIKNLEGEVIAKTDETWKSVADTSYRYPKSQLTINAQAEILNWQSTSFKDQSWPAASVVRDAGKMPFHVSEIPVPMKVPIEPLIITSGDKTYSSAREVSLAPTQTPLILDYGRNMAAFMRFSVDASAGDSIEVQPLEKLGNGPNRSYVYVCRQGRNDFETPYLSAFRYLRVKLRSGERVRVNAFQALYSSYPVSYLGSFECSEPFYGQLWEIVRWTTQLCMNDMFFDSPMHQEPIACTGDYFIQSMNNYYVFGDPWLTRQNLVQTVRMLQKNDYKMFHTSYSLIWVQMLRQYLQYTGDTTLVKELLPDVRRLLARFHGYLDQDYLISNAPDYMFMDWISIKGFNAHHPPAVIGMGYLTTMYAKALLEQSYLDSITGNANADTRQLYDSIQSGVNRRLWDSNRQLYRDGYPFITRVRPGPWLPADTNVVTYSPHMNSLAVLYGIAPSTSRASILNYAITQNEYELQPYFMWYVLNSLQSIGAIDQGLDLINRWKNGIDTATYTLKENWRDKTEFGYGGDYSHAWGGAAMYFLSRNILGISPGKPGYESIAIHPYTGKRVHWGKGSVPLNKQQVVQVEWKERDGVGYEFTYTIPRGRRAAFHIPSVWHNRTIKLNGRQQKRQAVIDLQPGVQRISVR